MDVAERMKPPLVRMKKKRVILIRIRNNNARNGYYRENHVALKMSC